MVDFLPGASPAQGPIPSLQVLSPEYQEMLLVREATRPPSAVYGTQAVNAYCNSTTVTTFKAEKLVAKRNPDPFTKPLVQKFKVTPRTLQLSSYSVAVEYSVATAASAFGNAPAAAFDLDSGITHTGKYMISMLDEGTISLKKVRLVEFFKAITLDVNLALSRYNPAAGKAGQIRTSANDGVTILPLPAEDGIKAKDMIKAVGQHKQKVQVPALKSFIPGGPNIYGTVLMDHNDWSDILISGDGAATAGMKGYETINSDNYFNPSLIKSGAPYNAETMYSDYMNGNEVPEYFGSINGYKVCMIPNIDDDLDISYNDVLVEIPENSNDPYLITSYIPLLSPYSINTYSFAKLLITDSFPGNGGNTSKFLTMTSHHGSIRTDGRQVILQPRKKNIANPGAPMESSNTYKTRNALEHLINNNTADWVRVRDADGKERNVMQIDSNDLLDFADLGDAKGSLGNATNVFESDAQKKVRRKTEKDAERERRALAAEQAEKEIIDSGGSIDGNQ